MEAEEKALKGCGEAGERDGGGGGRGREVMLKLTGCVPPSAPSPAPALHHHLKKHLNSHPFLVLFDLHPPPAPPPSHPFFISLFSDPRQRMRCVHYHVEVVPGRLAGHRTEGLAVFLELSREAGREGESLYGCVGDGFQEAP